MYALGIAICSKGAVEIKLTCPHILIQETRQELKTAPLI